MTALSDLAGTDSARAVRRLAHRHQRLLHDFCAVGLSLGCVTVLAHFLEGAFAVTVSVAAAVLLCLRRRLPFLVTLLVTAALTVGTCLLAAPIAVTTLARLGRPRWQLGVAALALWSVLFFRALPGPEEPARVLLLNAAGDALLVVVPIVLGRLLATRRKLRAQLRTLSAAQLRLNQSAVEAARAEERVRLAREMHDVVSHQMSLISMQAGVLQVAQEANRREIAGTIRELADTGLTELRGLVGSLRGTTHPAAAERTFGEVVELAERCGAEVAMDGHLAAERLPEQAATAVFRTVQEALTNVGKHAPGAATLVSITDLEGSLAVTVTNGRPDCTQTAATQPSRGGYGLIGLRERVEEVGGTLTADATATGGFAVSATYPIGRYCCPSVSEPASSEAPVREPV